MQFYDTAVYNEESPTPHLAKLAASGLRLDYHYVFRYCSPTRRSFLSGRFPNRITTVQPDGSNHCSDFLPLAFTLLPEKLASYLRNPELEQGVRKATARLRSLSAQLRAGVDFQDLEADVDPPEEGESAGEGERAAGATEEGDPA